MSKEIKLKDGRLLTIDASKLTNKLDREIEKTLNAVKPEIVKDSIEATLKAWPTDQKPSYQHLLEAFTEWLPDAMAKIGDAKETKKTERAKLRALACVSINGKQLTAADLDDMPYFLWQFIYEVTVSEFSGFL